jgi:predicted GTPase
MGISNEEIEKAEAMADHLDAEDAFRKACKKMESLCKEAANEIHNLKKLREKVEAMANNQEAMTIKEIIQRLTNEKVEAQAEEDHYESWLILDEGVYQAIEALKRLDKPKQEPLTVERIREVWRKGCYYGYAWTDVLGLTRDIEAEHGIKK